MASNNETVLNWTNTIDSYKREYYALQEETKGLSVRMEEQSCRYIRVADLVNKEREVILHGAFEALVKFVADILQYSDGQDEIGSLGIQFLPDAVKSFKALADYSEKIIDQESIEEVESTQEIGENGQIIERIKDLKQRMASDLAGLCQATSAARNTLLETKVHESQAQSALSNARDKQSGFFYDVFGDDDIDNAVNTDRRNLETWQSNVRAASDVFERLQALVSVLQELAAFHIESLLEKLSNLADGMRANFKNIDVIRRIDKDCWTAARLLEYHVKTNTEYTSRDDALRHIIKLLHTANKTIDEDNTVKNLKEAIEKMLEEKLGVAKAEELHQEKKFLAMPEDMDF